MKKSASVPNSKEGLKQPTINFLTKKKTEEENKNGFTNDKTTIRNHR